MNRDSPGPFLIMQWPSLMSLRVRLQGCATLAPCGAPKHAGFKYGPQVGGSTAPAGWGVLPASTVAPSG